MMQGLFSGKMDQPGPSLIGSLTVAGCLEAHLGLLSCGGVSQFLLHKDSKDNAHAGGRQQRAAAHT